jgi:uncharacterized protein
MEVFNRTILAVMPILPVERLHLRTAAGFAEHHALGLRAADALHLAVVAAHGMTLCTRDRKLADAATDLGIPVEFL